MVITGAKAFSRFFGQRPDSLTIGAGSVMDGVRFSVGPDGRLTIGRDCRLSEAVVLAESSVEIGDRVMIGWNATIADADFHPVDPAARRVDAEAISPVDNGLDRPWIGARPVIIGDDTWIGPNAAVLKGVRIGADCFVEPGSVVVNDVPARSRVLGNPAVVVESWEVGRMVNDERRLPGDWHDAPLPPNVAIHHEAYLETSYSFHSFAAERPDAVELRRGAGVYLGTTFDLGPEGRVGIGEYSLVNAAQLTIDGELEIGDHVMIAWGVVIMDSYRVAVDPDERRRGQPASVRPVRIAPDCWIGFGSSILPGARLGRGCHRRRPLGGDRSRRAVHRGGRKPGGSGRASW